MPNYARTKAAHLKKHTLLPGTWRVSKYKEESPTPYMVVDPTMQPKTEIEKKLAVILGILNHPREFPLKQVKKIRKRRVIPVLNLYTGKKEMRCRLNRGKVQGKLFYSMDKNIEDIARHRWMDYTRLHNIPPDFKDQYPYLFNTLRDMYTSNQVLALTIEQGNHFLADYYFDLEETMAAVAWMYTILFVPILEHCKDAREWLSHPEQKYQRMILKQLEAYLQKHLKPKEIMQANLDITYNTKFQKRAEEKKIT